MPKILERAINSILILKGIGVPAFQLPFNEAAEFWGEKVTVPADYFYSLEQHVRDRAFTVSHIATQGELGKVFDAISTAQANGTPFQDFKKQVGDVFERAGLKTSRMDLVFRNNLQSSYNAGRWKQQQDTRDQFPYLEYDAVNDSRTRPSHGDMDGAVYRSDDPVWSEWYPPNGHNCRCSVTARTEDHVKQKRKEVQEAVPDFEPDKAWNHNPGAAPFRGLVLNGLQDGWDVARSKPIRTASVPPLEGGPAGSMDAAVNAFRSVFGGDEAVLQGVIMSVSVMQKQESAWQWGHLIEDVLKNPSRVDGLAYKNGSGRFRLGRRYVRKLATGGHLEVETMLATVRRITRKRG